MLVGVCLADVSNGYICLGDDIVSLTYDFDGYVQDFRSIV